MDCETKLLIIFFKINKEQKVKLHDKFSLYILLLTDWFYDISTVVGLSNVEVIYV